MKNGTLIAIIFLCLVTAGHLLRLLLGLEITVEQWVLPMWVSVIAVVVPGGIAFLLWKESS